MVTTVSLHYKAASLSLSVSPTIHQSIVTPMDSEFTLAEMKELESMYKEIGGESLMPEFCQGVATAFSYAPSRVGKTAITMEQVKSWFQDRLKKAQPKGTGSSMALKLFVSDKSVSSNAAECSQKYKGTNVCDLSELKFEARSAKDNAWYDVASFLTYRVLCSGELEVRVRYSGYCHSDDEWVNVRRAVREQSIPLEPSECHKVKVGDPVLCFQKRQDWELYFDAHVIDVQKELHDIRGCSCIFHVRYDDDGYEEKLQWGSICYRPTRRTS